MGVACYIIVPVCAAVSCQFWKRSSGRPPPPCWTTSWSLRRTTWFAEAYRSASPEPDSTEDVTSCSLWSKAASASVSPWCQWRSHEILAESLKIWILRPSVRHRTESIMGKIPPLIGWMIGSGDGPQAEVHWWQNKGTDLIVLRSGEPTGSIFLNIVPFYFSKHFFLSPSFHPSFTSFTDLSQLRIK